jgi:hypothetical protein
MAIERMASVRQAPAEMVRRRTISRITRTDSGPTLEEGNLLLPVHTL